MNIAQEPGLVRRFQKWAAAPVTEEMDFVAVVLTSVLIATIVFAWVRILNAFVD